MQEREYQKYQKEILTLNTFLKNNNKKNLVKQTIMQ